MLTAQNELCPMYRTVAGLDPEAYAIQCVGNETPLLNSFCIGEAVAKDCHYWRQTRYLTCPHQPPYRLHRYLDYRLMGSNAVTYEPRSFAGRRCQGHPLRGGFLASAALSLWTQMSLSA